MRSPITIAVTTLIRETCNPRIFEWQQDLLAHLPLVPYFLLVAIALAFVLTPKAAQGLVMLPVAYAVVNAPLLVVVGTL